MNLNYTFEILSVNEQARCMEVLYKATNYPDTLVGVRLPFVDENLLLVINMYAPISLWIEQQKEIVVPLVGTSGEINEDILTKVLPEETESDILARQNKEMWEQIIFEEKVAAALVKFNVLAVDPTTIAVNTL